MVRGKGWRAHLLPRLYRVGLQRRRCCLRASARKRGAATLSSSPCTGARNLRARPTDTQVRYGRALIDAGADLVLGSHPHVVGGLEQYKGKYIVYSLGNFCFGGNSNPDDKDTIIFQQTFNVTGAGEVTDGGINIIPCSISSVPSTKQLPAHAPGRRSCGGGHWQGLLALVRGRDPLDGQVIPACADCLMRRAVPAICAGLRAVLFVQLWGTPQATRVARGFGHTGKTSWRWGKTWMCSVSGVHRGTYPPGTHKTIYVPGGREGYRATSAGWLPGLHLGGTAGPHPRFTDGNTALRRPWHWKKQRKILTSCHHAGIILPEKRCSLPADVV